MNTPNLDSYIYYLSHNINVLDPPIDDGDMLIGMDGTKIVLEKQEDGTFNVYSRTKHSLYWKIEVGNHGREIESIRNEYRSPFWERKSDGI